MLDKESGYFLVIAGLSNKHLRFGEVITVALL